VTRPRVVLDTKVSPPRFSLLEEGLLSVLSGRWLTTCHTGEAAPPLPGKRGSHRAILVKILLLQMDQNGGW